MNLSELINEIVSDWAYRVNDGMPNPKNPMHVKELEIVLNEMGLGHVKSEILQSLNEAEAGGFTNPALNKKVRYKNANGEDKEGIVGNLLRQPEDSPGRKAAEATLPPEGSPERETMNQELGAEKDGKAKPPEDAKGKEGEDGKEGGADAEAEKKKKAAAMFDPKTDPAMAARLDREKAANDKLAQKDKEGSEAEKTPTPGSPEDFKNKADKVAKDKEEAKKKGYDDSLHAMSDGQLDTAITDAEKKMNDAQKSGDDKAADKANTEYAQHKLEKEMRNASKGGDKEIADAAVGNFLARKKDYEEKYGEPYKSDIPYPNSDGGERTSAKWGDEEPKGPEAGPNAEPPMDEPSKPDTTPPADAEEPKDGEEPPAPAALDDKPEETKIDKTTAAAYAVLDKAEQDLDDIELLKKLRDDFPSLFNNMGVDWDKPDPELVAQVNNTKDIRKKFKQNAEKAKTKEQTTKAASNLKKRKTADGEALDVDTTPNGSLIIGVEHGADKESNKQAIEQIQKLPKNTKVMFVGEGGSSKDKDGNIEFGGEQDEIRNGVKGHFDNAEESSWDENADVLNDKSPVYNEIEKELGSKSKAKAAVWTNMYGQDGPDENMKPEDYLDDEGKQWIIDQAKKGGSSQFDGDVDWNNLTDAQKKDLYELNYNDEGKMGDNEIMKGQQAYNGFRQKELDRKIKEAEDAGYTVIAPVGNSHVDMRRQRMKSQQKPEQPTDTKPEDKPKEEPAKPEETPTDTKPEQPSAKKPEETPTDTKPKDKPEDKPKEEPAKPTETPKATKDDIKKEKPGKEAKTDSGGSLYSVGGGYYSDKPNGPAKYVRTESVIEMAFDNSLNEDVFALFEKSITGTLQNGEKITVQELPPRAVKKATQRAKAAAASSKEEPTQPTTSIEKPAEQPAAKKTDGTDVPGKFTPIETPPPKNEKGVEKDGKIAGTTIETEPGLKDIDPEFLKQKSTEMNKYYDDFKEDKKNAEGIAREKMGYSEQQVKGLKGEEKTAYEAEVKKNQKPTYNLCKVSLPNSNLFCSGNKGIPRKDMPQFKGEPREGTQAWDVLQKAKETDPTATEADGEPYFRQMLADKGIKVTDADVPSESLKATQTELVGDKVLGMKSVLDAGPSHPSYKKMTAPLYVSKDGYVVDGHHRWAAITAYNMEHPDNPLPLKTMIIDQNIDEAIETSNEFASEFGVAAKSGKQTGTDTQPSSANKADANNENPTTRDAVPTDEQANEQIAKEKEGLSHQENQAYEYLDGMSDEDKAEAIDKALNDRTIIQKAMQDTMVGNWLMKKGKMLKNVYKAVEQKYKTGRSGTTKDCSDAPKGPHANTNEIIKEAPQNRQDYLASLDKTGKKKEKGDDSKCKDVHVEDYQKRDEKGNPKYKTVPVYESGEKPDPANFGPDGAYYAGLGDGYIGPRQAGTEYGNASKEDAFKASELDSKTGYFKRDGKYYGVDGEEVNEKGQKLDAQGNTTQKTERCWLCFPPGKKVASTQEVADLEDDLTPQQKHVAHHAEHVEHERKHAVKHLAIEASLIIGGAMAGPWLLAKAGLGGAAAGAGSHGVTQAAGTVAKEAAHHGAGELMAHIAKDFGKHALAETLGVSNPYGAAGAGLGASALSGGILESFWKEIEGYDLVLEGIGDKTDEGASKDFFEKLCRLGLEKMKTYKMTPQQKLESIRSYKFEKAQKEKEKEKKDKLKDLASLLKEKTSNSKQNSINHFVEFASKRLNLKETPKVNLMSGNQFKNELAALGGYDPSSKEIFVATDKRLTADILRTIAHEMVHRKQEEKGFLKNIDKDGAAGSKIENQANSIAGILMREYGKVNKEIYNENINKMGIESLVREIISEITLEAKDETFTAIKKDTGMTSVFKSKEARDAAIKGGTHKMAKGSKEAPKKVAGSGMDYRQTPDMKKKTKKAEPKPTNDTEPDFSKMKPAQLKKFVDDRITKVESEFDKSKNKAKYATDFMLKRQAEINSNYLRPAGSPASSLGENNGGKYINQIWKKGGKLTPQEEDAIINEIMETPLAQEIPQKDRKRWAKIALETAKTEVKVLMYQSKYKAAKKQTPPYPMGVIMDKQSKSILKKHFVELMKNAKTPKQKQHYQKQLNYIDTLTESDTGVMYEREDGTVGFKHTSNKSAYNDPHNNTSVDEKIKAMNQTMGGNLDPKLAKKMQDVSKKVAEASAGIEDACRKFDEGRDSMKPNDRNAQDAIIAKVVSAYPVRGGGKKNYLDECKGKPWFDKKAAELGIKTPVESEKDAARIAIACAGDTPAPTAALKVLIKVSEMLEKVTPETAAKLAPAFNLSADELLNLANSAGILKAAAKTRRDVMGEAHTELVTEIQKADKATKPPSYPYDKNADNGPHQQAYVKDFLHRMHFASYILGERDGVSSQNIGGDNVEPEYYRQCLAELSGYTGKLDTPEGRQGLVSHLEKRVRVSPKDDSIVFVNGKTKAELGKEVYRTKGESKSVVSGLGKEMQGCLKGKANKDKK